MKHTRLCPWCDGQVFGRPNKKYCSIECRDRARYKRRHGGLYEPEVRQCSGPDCTKTFLTKQPTHKYCSDRCKQRVNNAVRLERQSGRPCSVDGCVNVGVYASGLCRMHYARRYNGVPFDEPKWGVTASTVCRRGECVNVPYKLGLCASHYRRKHAKAGKEWALAQLEWSSESRTEFYGGDVESVDRMKVFDRDGWVCQLCGERVDPLLKGPDPLAASLDHIVPVSLGGDHTYANCQLAHLGCNAAKGASLEV